MKLRDPRPDYIVDRTEPPPTTARQLLHVGILLVVTATVLWFLMAAVIP